MLPGNQRPFGPYAYVASTPAPYVNGKWMVDVAQSGRYEITLRQLPSEAAFVIQADEARIKVGPSGTRPGWSPNGAHGREVLRWKLNSGQTVFADMVHGG